MSSSNLIEYFYKSGVEKEIPVHELVPYCINIYKQYDLLSSEDKQDVLSPYSNVILYKTEDQKYIMVPDDVKQIAFDKYKSEISLVDNTHKQETPKFLSCDSNSCSINKKSDMKLDENDNSKKNTSISKMNLFLIILFIIFSLVLLSKANNSSRK
jgi:hypothetical protein